MNAMLMPQEEWPVQSQPGQNDDTAPVQLLAVIYVGIAIAGA